MKKLLCVLLAVMTVLALAACGDKTPQQNGGQQDQPAQSVDLKKVAEDALASIGNEDIVLMPEEDTDSIEAQYPGLTAVETKQLVVYWPPVVGFGCELVMDKIPRKTMGVGLLILIAVLGYIYSLQTSMLLITLIGFFLITFVYMYVCYASAVYVPEIWPTEAKLRGSGLANAVGRISGIAAPYAVAVLLSSYGVTGVFILLGAVSIIVAIAIATIGIETKGVSVESLSIDAVANK